MGQVVDSRPITVSTVPTSAQLTSWQVKYVSQDTKGRPWTTMATIIKPAAAWSGPPKLLAFLPWIDVLDTACNPSYQLRTDYAYLASTGMIGEMVNLGAALDRGWTVVVPDYLGPENQFAAGYVEGRSTLDGIRAALNFAPAALPADTRTAIFGYSGGSRGAEFAAELAPGYAPELNLVGTAAGGLVADMGASAALMNGGLFAGINYQASFGLARAYPELNLPSYFLDPHFERELATMCQAQVLATYPFTYVQDRTVDRVWPLGDPNVVAVLDTLKAGRYGTPNSPVYLWMAGEDQIAITPNTRALVSDYCTRGVPVTYVEYPGTEHVSAETAGSGAALDWIADRLNGIPASTTCH
ncbi:lipase family protein [Nocardia sp. NPDC127526]|uniref:lipase family protein n=1 Tax=Nocardia sp. NPDC127526 TaxID=3345393 RepID=UPI0036352679